MQHPFPGEREAGRSSASGRVLIRVLLSVGLDILTV